jgi:hypothetical protein
MKADPLDIVYTWVDGSAESFAEERARFAKTKFDFDPQRTRDNLDLLKFSLRSVERHAPWRGRIFIVTSRPLVPKWLNTDNPSIRMIYHDEIMPSELLPSFNAFAIESFLHRIPSLSARFVHFNDDMLLMRTAERSIFETDDGRMKLYFSSFLPTRLRSPFRQSPHRAGCANTSRALDKIFGPHPHPDQAHQARIIDVEAMEEVVRIWPEEFARTRAARFRNHDTILPHKLLAAYLSEKGLADTMLGRNSRNFMQFVRARNSALFNRWRLARVMSVPPVFFCLNDDFGAVPSPPAEQAVRKFLEVTFPEPSSFERPLPDPSSACRPSGLAGPTPVNARNGEKSGLRSPPQQAMRLANEAFRPTSEHAE